MRAWSTAPARGVSLDECVGLCAADGGVPACPQNQSHFEQLLSVADGRYVWVGMYQWNTTLVRALAGELRLDRCVSGAATNYSDWLTPPDLRSDPKQCAIIAGASPTYSGLINRPCESDAYWRGVPCLCEAGVASSEWAEHVQVLRATIEDDYQGRSRSAAVAFVVYTLVWLAYNTLVLFTSAGARRVLFGRRRAAAASTTAEKLADAQAAGDRVRLRVSTAIRLVGSAMAILGIMPLMVGFVTPLDSVIGTNLWGQIVCLFGTAIWLCSLLPTDSCAIRGACAIFVVLFGFLGVFNGMWLLTLLVAWSPGSIHFVIMSGVSCIIATSASLSMSPALCCCKCSFTSPRWSLRQLWRVLRLFYCALGTLYSYLSLSSIASLGAKGLYQDSPIGVPATFGSICLYLIAASFTARNRARVVRWVGSLGPRGDEQQQAAAVAALCGGGEPQEVLSNAASLFRCLSIDQLSPADLAASGATNSKSATPTAAPAAARTDGGDTTLAERTREAELGEVEAFLSHSWSDEMAAPGQKHAALTTWAATCKTTPTIWLDKACIQQDAIDEALACLPVFLAGCKRLVVVAGPTYVSRLWCVMELFTFVQMHGAVTAPEHVDILPIGGAGATLETVAGWFSNFRGERAKCFKPADRQKLLAVVEASMGDFTVFNQIVRDLFEKRAHKAVLVLDPDVAHNPEADNAPVQSV